MDGAHAEVESSLHETLRYPFMAAAVGMLLAAGYARRKIVPSEDDLRRPGGRLDVNARLGKYILAIVVSSALCESVAILGLFLFFLGADLNTLYVFTTASAVGFLVYRPNRNEIDRLSSFRKG